MLTEVEAYYSCTRDHAKSLFCRLLYGGSIKEWETEVAHEVGRQELLPTPPYIQEFAGQLLILQYTLASQRPDLVRMARAQGKKNPYATALFYILSDVENEILLSMESYPGLKPNGLIFDGLGFIPSRPFTEADVRDLESHIFSECNVQVRLKIKPWADTA